MTSTSSTVRYPRQNLTTEQVLAQLRITGARTDDESDEEHPCADQVDLDLAGWSDSDLESDRSVPVQHFDSDSSESSSSTPATRGRKRLRGANSRGRSGSRGRGRRGCPSGSRGSRGVGSRGSRGGGVRGRGRGRGPVRTEVDLFTWELYNLSDTYHPSDWLSTFHRGNADKKGVLVDTTGFQPVDFYQLFFPDEAYQLMVDQSNLYGEQLMSNITELSNHSRFQYAKDITLEEMKAYSALQIAMGICCKPELEDYWRTYWLTQVAFGDVMSRNRYELISSFLHFNDNETRIERGNEGYDPLHKVRPLLHIIDPLYSQIYSPKRELSIDESMIKFKGRVFFRQFLPAKPIRFGIKQFCMSEAKTGYALKFLVYTGRETFTNLQVPLDVSVTEKVVLHLIEGMEEKGHVVYTDSYYTSPNLAKALKDKGIGLCGTVRQGRKNMPPDLHVTNSQLRKGDDPIFMKSVQTDVVACGWHDTKYVTFVSSVHTDNSVDRRQRSKGGQEGHRTIVKPLIAEDYNQYMGGVDLTDQLLGTYAYPHKVSKWYHALYHRLREVALTNGYIIYKTVATGPVMSPRTFREKVVDGLLSGYTPHHNRNGQTPTAKPARLVERHFCLRRTDGSRPDCKVCSSRTKPGWQRTQTNYYCVQCKKEMCPGLCFMLYHTYEYYTQEVARQVYHQ